MSSSFYWCEWKFKVSTPVFKSGWF